MKIWIIYKMKMSIGYPVQETHTHTHMHKPIWGHSHPVYVMLVSLFFLLFIKKVLHGKLEGELIRHLVYTSISQIASTDPYRGYIEGIGIS